ncbi:MAG: hypothetical protein ACHQZR_05810 [Candidatus Limnocylindrales bacterium]
MTALPWRSRITGHGEVAPADLVPNPHNWRTHPADQQQALAGALGEVGWVAGVTVNQTTGHVVDGHLRIDLAVARHEQLVPVTYIELSEDEERLVLATLDPLAAMAEAEASKLADLLEDLAPADAALRALLDDLGRDNGLDTVRAGLVDPDEVPDLPEPTDVTVQPGELYALGDHRLLCGDCTDAADVARVTAGVTVDILWTDPPYGVEYQTKLSRGEAVARHRRRDGLEVPHDAPADIPGLDVRMTRVRPSPRSSHVAGRMADLLVDCSIAVDPLAGEEARRLRLGDFFEG